MLICWPRREGEDLDTFFVDKNLRHKNDDGHYYMGKREQDAVATLYKNLVEVCKEESIPHKIVYNKRYRWIPYSNTDITLCYHIHKNANQAKNDNEWCSHTSGSPGYFTFDQMGYAGFSTVCNVAPPSFNEGYAELFKTKEWFEEFASDYIGNNVSRNTQYIKAPKIEGEYVFIAGQLSYDSVLQLSDIPGQVYYDNMARRAQELGLKVVYKPHPGEMLKDARKGTFKAPNGSIVTQGNIHELIAGAKAVITVNSGVGMEALFHRKPVYICGSADYEGGCYKVRKGEYDRIDFGWTPDQQHIENLLYYLHKQFYVDVYDKESIRKRLKFMYSLQV